MTKDVDGFVNGVTARDEESGEEYTAMARVVVNATGPWTDHVRQFADASVQPMIAPSQGIHLVFDRSFLPGSSAIMVPHTSDGRVMFAIPWHGHTLVGTTDTPISEAPLDPSPLEAEIEFILQTSAEYLHHPPTRNDILSIFVGIRPLVKAGSSASTATLSRDHTIHIDESGLLNITGGKWTTYRHMAEDCVNHAMTLGKLPERECVTKRLNIHGYREDDQETGSMWVYGSDADAVRALAKDDPSLLEPLHPALPYCGAEVLWAVRQEMARTLDDVLSRRTRALFLNARAALEMSPAVAEIMAKELKQGDPWVRHQLAAFRSLAETYLVPPRETN